MLLSLFSGSFIPLWFFPDWLLVLQRVLWLAGIRKVVVQGG